MAKAGKKVLILEQHDQAGGCCHTFIDKGYEFDVGIHYIGKMGHPNINKTFMDQICDGQLGRYHFKALNQKSYRVYFFSLQTLELEKGYLFG